MFEINTILRKVFVQQFYLLNAGFFLLIITLAFGFMSGAEHKALAQFFIASPILLLIPISVWFLYLLKIVNFNKTRLLLSENRFVYNITLLSTNAQLLSLGIVTMMQFLPATVYALFLLLMALKLGNLIVLVLTLIAQLTLVGFGTFLFYKTLQHQEREIHVWRIKAWFDRRFSKPFFIISTSWVLRREPMLVLGTKIFSGALLFAVTQLYKTDVYDWRLLAMGAVISVVSNYMMIGQLHLFENYHFQFLKNLPIKIPEHLLNFLLTVTILMIPEFVVILKNFPTNLATIQYLNVLVFMLSGCVHFYALHYLSIKPENFSRWILATLIGGTLLILFQVPLYFISVLLIIEGFLILRARNYG